MLLINWIIKLYGEYSNVESDLIGKFLYSVNGSNLILKFIFD
jgi:hypothetical protein